MAVINLTEARIRDLPAGSGIWRDEQVKGLLVVCHRSTKTYAVQGDVRRNGRHVRTVRMKIDRCDRLGLREARNQAKVLMSQIQSGVDPAAKKPETGVTLKQALEHHLSEKTFRPSTVESYRYHLDKYLVRLRGRAVADITRADVREIYAKMKEQRGQTTASAAIRTLRALINTAMRMDETITSNPVQVLRIPMTNRRQVAPIDIAGWWKEVQSAGTIRRDLHIAMMLTGARRSSILQVRREDVDLDKGVITFRHMKIGGPMMFPMGTELTAVVKARMEADDPLNSPWLWPSATAACGHITEPKEQRRNLPSPHEYRHYARTLYIAAGVPYAESALLLGQRLPGASGGYVHPEHLVEHLRPHVQALEDLVLGERAVAPPSEESSQTVRF